MYTPPAQFDPDECKWMALANCQGVDPDIFFTDRGVSIEPAKTICRACVVREECLEYALAHSIKFGTWGGESERARRRMRRERNRARRLGAA
jgi:WhiB family redox-sensing transcriptional regulator